jgi:integrase
MRQGECLGLTWEAIDLDTGQLSITWQLQAIPWVDRKNKGLGPRLPDGLPHRHLVDSWHLVPPKSKKGYRVVPLLGAEVAALRAYRDQWEPNPYDLVWTDKGRPRNGKQDLREFWAMQDQAGVRHPSGRYYTVHESRNTAAMALQDAGTDDFTIQGQLGHSSIVTSRGYMKSNTATARAALERVQAAYDNLE